MWKNSHFPRQAFWIVTILTAISRYFIYLFFGLHTLNLVTRGNAMHFWLLMLTRLPVPNIHTPTYVALIIFSLCFSHISLPMPHCHTSTLRQIRFAASREWNRNDGKHMYVFVFKLMNGDPPADGQLGWEEVEGGGQVEDFKLGLVRVRE